MARDHLLAIDQGTTSTRAVVYDARLRPVGQGQVEVPPTYPNPGWVEHDPKALVDSAGPMVVAAMADAGIKPDHIAGIGLTNQRETTIVWDRNTGKAIGPALVWQDRRTESRLRASRATSRPRSSARGASRPVRRSAPMAPAPSCWLTRATASSPPRGVSSPHWPPPSATARRNTPSKGASLSPARPSS